MYRSGHAIERPASALTMPATCSRTSSKSDVLKGTQAPRRLDHELSIFNLDRVGE